MVGWIWLGVALLAIWPISQTIDRFDPGSRDDDPVDRFFVTVLSVLASLFWPMLLVGWLGYRLSRWVWGRILGLDHDHDRDHARKG